jgi:transposase
MDRIRDRVAGLDVHRDSVMAAVSVINWLSGEIVREQQRFSTTVGGLGGLGSWLGDHGVTTVAMEATGVYWKPVFYALEGRFEEVWVCNAMHVKNVPGRKTDVSDAMWLADVVAHGMVKASFVPPPPIRAVRDLSRYRKAQADARTREIQRLDKVLQDACVKLTSVASTVWSKSSRAMIEALIAGERDPAVLAGLALGKMRAKTNQLTEALASNWRPHHSFMARQIIAHIDFLDASINELSIEIAERVHPFQDLVSRWCEIPGVGPTVAEIVVAETGGDMAAFSTPERLCAWAGVAPANRESAGKRQPAGTRHGTRWLRRALIEAARAAARSNNTYLAAQYQRISRRRGANKAAVAVAHSILTIMWHLAVSGDSYHEAGGDYFERRRDPAREAQRLVTKLAALGYRTTLEPAA